MTARVVPWIPAAIWAAVIFFLSSRETLPVPLEHGLDKVVHLFAFLILGALLARATWLLGLTPAIAIALGWLYGLSDEVHQAIVPSRQPDVFDWVADAVGTVLGVILFLAILKGLSRSVPAGKTVSD